MPEFDAALFDSVFFQDLLRYEWLRKKMPTTAAGMVNGPSRAGSGQEFAGFHSYRSGDDLRYVDWPLYARSGQLFVREFIGESGRQTLFLLDMSLSMQLGQPHKYRTALRIAGAYGYLALQQGGSVQIGLCAESFRYSPCFRQRTQFSALLAFLSWHKPQGRVEWQELNQVGSAHHDLVLLSDLWAAQPARAILTRLAVSNHRLSLLHLLSPQELLPNTGFFLLHDVESGEQLACRLTHENIQIYQQKLAAFCHDWRTFCLPRRISYQRGDSGMPLWQLVGAIGGTLG
jgi:uncharacterized protein (DUF58 family)